MPLNRILLALLALLSFSIAALAVPLEQPFVNGAGVSTANPLPVTGTVTTTGTADQNVKQLNGTTVDTNSGNKSAGTLRAVIATDQPQLTNPLKTVLDNGASSLVDKSGTITTGNTAQVLAASNSSRYGFLIQNVSTSDLWFSTLATAIVGQPSIKIPPGAMYESPPHMRATGTISIIGPITAQAYAAREW